MDKQKKIETNNCYRTKMSDLSCVQKEKQRGNREANRIHFTTVAQGTATSVFLFLPEVVSYL